MKSDPSIMGNLFASLPSVSSQHARTTALYALLKTVARNEIESQFADTDGKAKAFGPFGEIVFPYFKMGAIDSLDLFGLDELIIFSYYWANRAHYRRVADIGANIGLHSLALSRCGFEVKAYEPDPKHFGLLKNNLTRNAADRVQPIMAAVSKTAGVMEFVRVLGNTTGSHLVGSKPNPYGELEKFPVQVDAIGPILEWADLVKIDAEGHEKEILLATDIQHWRKCDAMVEVGSEENAKAIFDHFMSIGVNAFAQKLGWRVVARPEDMPTSYRDGSLFVSRKPVMQWTQETA
ncbi:MAG: FkbM family methyltransferase [Pseudomonadota bacterium]